MKTKFTCAGFRAITETMTMSEAASIFANRQARREYGKTGYARALREDSYTQDGNMGTYQAFIGYTPPGAHNRGTTTGRNVWLTIYRENP